MGAFYDDIPDFLIEWIGKQHMFWVATAPLTPIGHVNVSPKGVAGTFKVIDSKTVMYQDLSGSGSETIAHLRENGRITVMFHELEGAPRICRLFGTGLWHEFGSSEYERLIPQVERLPGSRAAIVVHVHKVGTSCGFAIPYYRFTGHRTKLLEHFSNLEEKDSAALGPSMSTLLPFTITASPPSDPSITCDAAAPSNGGLFHYWGLKNGASIDGLPALYIGEHYAKYFRLDPYALKPFAPKKHDTVGNRIKTKAAGALKVIVENIADSRFALGVFFGAGIVFAVQKVRAKN